MVKRYEAIGCEGDINRGVNRATAATCPIVPDLANASDQFWGGNFGAIAEIPERS